MTGTDFNLMVEEQFQLCRELLCKKGADYSEADTDRCSNFKENAADLDLSPFKIWYVYFNKGWRAIKSYVNKGRVESEDIHARITDAINYLILLRALIEDQKSKCCYLDECATVDVNILDQLKKSKQTPQHPSVDNYVTTGFIPTSKFSNGERVIFGNGGYLSYIDHKFWDENKEEWCYVLAGSTITGPVFESQLRSAE